jgi:hypothetical protein
MAAFDGDYSGPDRNANLRNKKYPVEDYLDPDMELDYAKSHGEVRPDYVADHVDNYRALRAVLEEAFNRCAFGKGKSRHAVGNERFEDQQIFKATRFYGDGGLYYQMEKKLRESFKMLTEKKVLELMDVIVYACAAIIYARESRHEAT